MAGAEQQPTRRILKPEELLSIRRKATRGIWSPLAAVVGAPIALAIVFLYVGLRVEPGEERRSLLKVAAYCVVLSSPLVAAVYFIQRKKCQRIEEDLSTGWVEVVSGYIESQKLDHMGRVKIQIWGRSLELAAEDYAPGSNDFVTIEYMPRTGFVVSVKRISWIPK